MSRSMHQTPYDPRHPYGFAPHTLGPQSARNGLGTAALVLGIIGTLAGLIPFFFWLSGILGLLALILGLSGRGRVKRGEAANKGATTTGAILGLVALILAVVGAVITFKLVGDAVDEINKATSNATSSKEPAAGSNAKAAGDTSGATKGADPTDKPEATDLLEAGDTSIYDDDLKVTVSQATAYTPGEFAAGHTKGNKAYLVTVVIENAGKEKFDGALLAADARTGKDGAKAERIFDEKAGRGLTESLLPGKKATLTFAFDTPADARTLTVEVSPGISYKASMWELKL
ncbi:DUF4352 domain-containing protein [Streptomyces sp. NBC_00829]|uniref:DUF4352 domain-containing protein n=1 Tax=Streptomyces sp. NBC_00829 TaxID=2903679 RepID=UPI00386EB086|nr:DUF4352 domain-containing protein [Streptomyces sp. NBC_00829]